MINQKLTFLSSKGQLNQPPGLYQDMLIAHRKTVFIHVLMLIILIIYSEYTEEAGPRQMMRLEHKAVIDIVLSKQEAAGISPMNTVKLMTKLTEGTQFILEAIVNSKEKVTLVGKPKTKLLFRKPTQCDKTSNVNCWHPFTWPIDIKQIYDQHIMFPYDNEHKCKDLGFNASLLYRKDNLDGQVQSQICENCLYPVEGHQFNFPGIPVKRPEVAAKIVKCVVELLNADRNYRYNFPTNRLNAYLVLISFTYVLHNADYDTYVYVRYNFEQLHKDAWWFNYEIQSSYFVGFFGKGNYHGIRDTFSALVNLLILGLVLICVVKDVQMQIKYSNKFFSDLQFWLKCSFNSMIVGFAIYRFYLHYEEAHHFDLVVDEISQYIPARRRSRTITLGDKLNQLFRTWRNIPIFAVFSSNNMRVQFLQLLYLTIVFKFLLYDDYGFKFLSLIIVSIRKSIVQNMNLLMMYVFTIGLFAAITTFDYSDCAWEFRDFRESFITVFRLSMDEFERPYSSLANDCQSVWAMAHYVLIFVVLKLFFMSIIMSNMIFVVQAVRSQTRSRLVITDHLVELERRNKLNSDRIGPEKVSALRLKDKERIQQVKDYLTTLLSRNQLNLGNVTDRH